METAEFCGTTGHTTMEPEWKAYQVSAHAEGAMRLLPRRARRRRWGNPRSTAHASCEGGYEQRPTNRYPRRSQHACGLVKRARRATGRRSSTATRSRAWEFADTRPARDGDPLQCHWRRPLRIVRRGMHSLAHEPSTTIEFSAPIRAAPDDPVVQFTDPERQVQGTISTGPSRRSSWPRRSPPRWTALIATTGPPHLRAPRPNERLDNAIAGGNVAARLPFARREAVAR